MKLISHGAAREVTGTCHELIIGEKHLLLDCGLFQGKRRESAEKNRTFTFDPTKIDAMILTHAHADHVGRVPLLYKKGYTGPIYATYATKDLAEVMLQDSAYIQEKDEEYMQKHGKADEATSGALYTQQDAAECMSLFVGKNYNETFDLLPGVRCTFYEAGHILGAVMVFLEIEEGNGEKAEVRSQKSVIRFGFSGDLGRSMLPIIRDPATLPQVDYLICESTYGDRVHDDIDTAVGRLKEIILETAQRGGKILIPAFSLERTQEIIYDLHLLWDRKEIPSLPIVIDSPLASRVTEVFMKHPECFDQKMYDEFLGRAHNPFHFSLVTYTETVEESKELNNARGPMIIMAGSGMCEAGRIRHHLKNELEDAKNSVIAVGFMAEETLGRKLLDPDVTAVKIFDQMVRKKAQIHYINAYSGHADKNDLDAFISAQKSLKKLFLVHGEEKGMYALAERTIARQKIDVIMPERGKENAV